MKTEIQVAKSLKKKFKEWLKGCGEKSISGGTCGNLSREKQLMTSDNFKTFQEERVVRHCLECTKGLFLSRGAMISHKESCERQLEFLENTVSNHKVVGGKDRKVPSCIPVKIEDLKQAIKLYDTNAKGDEK